MSDPSILPVGGEAPYDVVVGHDLAGRLPDLLGSGVTRVAVICPESLTALGDAVAADLTPYDVLRVAVPEGEVAKTIDTASACWEALGAAGFTRSDAVVTVGGGSTTDLGGFVAATWLRGVRVVHVPTTLLAMVDAAVGGKTGINTGAGKNLVGSFHHPAGVLCDLSLLATLPRAEVVAGLGEVVKCGFIADPEILRLVEEHHPEDLLAHPATSPVLRELVERAVAVKVDVVARDFREAGGSEATGAHPGREALNYGHTLAHAIERAEAYAVRHGEAVAIGCVFVAEVAHRAGLIDADLLARHRSTLSRVGLPTSYAGADFETLLATMRVDKKSRGAQVRLVVLQGPARPRILAGPDDALLREAFAAVSGDTS